MGGHAFRARLGAKAVFPRMAPGVYHKLKASCTEALQRHFKFVGVPPEDPEKPDFGDLDIMAFDPISHDTPSSEEIRVALGAEHVITNGQSRNFALLAEGSPSEPIMTDIADHDEPRQYHQVDLTILATRSLWESVIFHHSYGDLGLILTLFCKPYGLAYSQGGLKVRDSPYSYYCVQWIYFPQVGLKAYQKRHDNHPFTLSTSPRDISSFLGLDYGRLNEGFSTRLAIFDWLATSRFFRPEIFLRTGNILRERKMYQEFVSYANARAPSASRLNLDQPSDSPVDFEALAVDLGIVAEATVEEALVYFGRRDEWYLIAESIFRRKALKEKLNGKLVEQITGLKGVIIRSIIASVKEMASEDELVLMEPDEIQGLIQKAASHMG